MISSPKRLLSVHRQFLAFALIGSIATSVHFIVLAILVEQLGFKPVWSSAVGFCVSALLNYSLNYMITFGAIARHVTALPRFLIVAIFGLSLNSGIMLLGQAVFGIHYLLSQVCATVLVLLFNFTANRQWSFQP